MSELKVGTKVRIKTDLVVDQMYGSAYFVARMVKFYGVETEICDTTRTGFRLDCDDLGWNWTPEMFDVIE